MDAKTFVVPLDASEYSERALPVAESLAARVGGALLLVSARFRGPLDPHAYLEEQAARVTRCPVDIFATKDEHAPAAIAHALAGGDDRTVCMTTHGRGSWRWAAVGSVAEEVIRSADRPLVLVGRCCRADFLERGNQLLVCADRAEAAATLAPVVKAWAAELATRVRVAVVVHPLDVESAEHPEIVLGPIAHSLGLSCTEEADLLRANCIAGALVDHADEIGAALIAMSSQARTGIERFSFGSETMAVVHLAPCPVLVTRTPPA